VLRRIRRNAAKHGIEHRVVFGFSLQSAELAQNLATGFEGLWRKAMRDLREIDFHPGPRGAR
jgi:hypothetical protein